VSIVPSPRNEGKLLSLFFNSENNEHEEARIMNAEKRIKLLEKHINQLRLDSNLSNV